MRRAAALWVCALAACEGGTEGREAVDMAVTDAAISDAAPPDGAPSLVPAPALPTLRLTADGRRLRDALGREVILRGVNAGGRAKFPPFFAFPFRESGRPEQSEAPPFAEAVERYLDRPVAWGHDVLRLPFSWEAVEPRRGEYDATYLERYAAVAEAAGARGLRVVVDFHQDVFARPFCGDGFPLWALPQPVPEPPEDCSQWFAGYLSNDDVRRAYDRFWADEDGLRDAFAAMWRHVAARLWQVDAVVGFEIINEPGWGTADPEVWARDVLTPFYSEMARVVREAAPGALVFFDATGPNAIEARTALERPEGEGLVFAPHYYDPVVILQGRAPARPDVEAPIGRWAAYGERWDVPVLLGEFGARWDATNARPYVEANFAALDATRMHGTLWEYSATVDEWNDEGMSVVDGEGNARETALAAVRVYPMAVSGSLVSFSWAADAGEFEVRWDATPGVTEIALPAALFPGGIVLGPEGVDAVAVDAVAGRVRVRTDAAGSAALVLRRKE